MALKNPEYHGDRNPKLTLSEILGLPKSTDRTTEIWVDSNSQDTVRRKELPKRRAGISRAQTTYENIYKGIETIYSYGYLSSDNNRKYIQTLVEDVRTNLAMSQLLIQDPDEFDGVVSMFDIVRGARKYPFVSVRYSNAQFGSHSVFALPCRISADDVELGAYEDLRSPNNNLYTAVFKAVDSAAKNLIFTHATGRSEFKVIVPTTLPSQELQGLFKYFGDTNLPQVGEDLPDPNKLGFSMSSEIFGYF